MEKYGVGKAGAGGIREKREVKAGRKPRLFLVDKKNKKVPILYAFKVQIGSINKEKPQK